MTALLKRGVKSGFDSEDHFRIPCIHDGGGDSIDGVDTKIVWLDICGLRLRVRPGPDRPGSIGLKPHRDATEVR